jgi:predicted ATPase/class 3 adenylate cyclase
VAKELSFNEKIDKIQRYLPKGLTEKILSQRDKIEGERKQVTVMFCDMEGFTSLSERLNPEEVYDIVDQVYELLIHKVHNYEGTVNELTGDGILALFGAPIALEDAPQRAIRSGLAIHREMVKFSDRMKEERQGLPTIKMRIGIHTGPVVVGTLGNNLRVEFKAVGDTVNLASRMEGLADPGATYVSGETFKLTEGLFRFEALGEREVKGKKEPVRVYRVIAPSTRRTRFDVSAERGLTPFVGRERELDLLLDGFERAKGGRGQAFSIIAEAGLGKSRLLYEFRKAVTNEDVIFLEGRCLSYSKGVSYHPIIDILRANFDIQEGDRDSEIAEKVRTGLKILRADEGSTLPYLLELLSVENSGIDKIPMSPEARKDRIMEAVKLISLKGSVIRPLVVAVEDLHWIDKSSEEYLKNLLDSISGARLFLIFTYRPEFVHTWGGKSYHSQVNLNRLSNRESLMMVSHLLGTKDLDGKLEEFILEKTEGVPFFIEEFIKSLKELNIIKKRKNAYRLAKNVQAVSIPSTIQDVIMARVDMLPQGAKELLQTGSVIEREFGYELIKRVNSIQQEELLSNLSILKDSELLYERGIYPDTTYIFKHALTREVVYNSLMTKKKKILHENIAIAIEELYKNNLKNHYAQLAEHYIMSENYEKGAEYTGLSGEEAEKTASFPDAITYAKKRTACLERLPRTAEIMKQIIDARTDLGYFYIRMDYFEKAKDPIESIVSEALKLNSKKRLSQIYTIIGIYKWSVEEDFSEAFRYLKKALSVAHEINDIPSLRFSNYWIGVASSFVCKFENALSNFREALDIAVATNSLWDVSVIKSCLSYFVYIQEGNINMASETSREAMLLAEKTGDIFPKAFVYTNYGISCYLKGLIDDAINNLMKGIAFCQKINLYTWNAITQFYLGEVYYELGDYEKSKRYYNQSILLIKPNKVLHSWSNLFKICLAKAMVKNNEKPIDLEFLHNHATKNKVEQYSGIIRRSIAEILLNIDNQHLAKAENWIKKAIEADKRNGMRWNLARDYGIYAEILKLKGEDTKSIENLRKGKDILRKSGADGWVKKYEKRLAQP